MGAKKGIPENSSVVIPRLFCRDVEAEVEFCKRSFDAVDLGSRPGPDGAVAHALVTIGGAMVMIDAEWPGGFGHAPSRGAGSPVVLYVYVEDVDQAVERALAQGARLLMSLADQFWGDRIAWIEDTEGHVWTVASRIEETTEAERAGRWSEIVEKSKG